MRLIRRTFTRETFVNFSSFEQIHKDCPIKWVGLSYTFKFIHTKVSYLAITIKGISH